MLSVLLTIITYCMLAIGSVNCGHTRMTGGTEITIEDAPYLVQLRAADGDVFCGGTLVSPDYVITAAHCFDGTGDYSDMVVVGGASTMSENEGVQRKIASVKLHPEYGLYTKHSDAAVIKLDNPMSGEYITPIPLCQQSLNEGIFVQVSGWGRTEFGGIWDRKLRTARLPVRSEEVCQKEFGDFVVKNMFCASGLETKGTCFGDSGGPAIYLGQLCGLVAFSYKCGEVGYTSAFTDVYAVRSFLEDNMMN